MCSGGQRRKSLSKNAKLSFVVLRSKLLWTIREYLRIDSVHSVIMVSSLWTIHNVCLSDSENFFPGNHRIA
jgi:hypothetical protein